MMTRHTDTIVALSTGEQLSAIGMVRLSGPDAIRIVNQLLESRDLAAVKSHTLHFGYFYQSPARREDELIDEVVAGVYRAGRSFTGEDTVEISAHGSPYILSRIIDACVAAGARPAGPGEFTQRAFLSGRMDLAQAEAVADLIAAENKAMHEIALRQMRGGFSSELAQLREGLVNFTALIELELDFSDEDVEFADRSQLKDLVRHLKSKIEGLISSFAYGNAIKNGVPVAIIGKPNAGKSTLLNALLKEERAIVSDIAGTTRDVIEETITLDGITFRFIDTAGIRETEDTIEAIGVERAKEKVQQAAIVIHLYEESHDLLHELSDSLAGKIVFNLMSKVDVGNRVDEASDSELTAAFPDYQHFGLSVRTGYNLDRLTSELVAHFKDDNMSGSVIISNIRHKEALEKSFEALSDVEAGLEMNLSGDLLSLHLKDALYHIGAITGKIDVDKDVLGTIFGKFCIGK